MKEDESKLVKIIPKEAWSQLAKTAGKAFEKIIYPLTATTEGIGKMIERKFSKLENEEKIIATKVMQETSEKVDCAETRKKKPIIKPEIVFESLNNTASQTDETMRSLWSNLLANEFLDGDVHPEISKILTKITSVDALLLMEIAKNDKYSLSVKVLKAIAHAYSLKVHEKTFNHVHLKNLDLVHRFEGTWYTTTKGKEFLKSVSDPE